MRGKRAKILRRMVSDADAKTTGQNHFVVPVTARGREVHIVSPDPRWSYRQVKKSYNRLRALPV